MKMVSIAGKKNNSLIIRTMSRADIPQSRIVGQEAWSDVVSRDLGRKVTYPTRSRRIIETYMWKEPGGCLVVVEDGEIIGNAFSHVWGRVGWVGPIEILPQYQNRGIGRMLLAECEKYLISRGCEIIGVETMPHISKNLHFYLSGGYIPSALTLIMEKPVRLVDSDTMPDNVREFDREELEEVLPRIRELSAQVNPLLDFSIEFAALFKMNLGQCFLFEENNEITGLALLHSYKRSRESNYTSIKIVLVDDRSRMKGAVFRDLIKACEYKSKELGRNRIYTRFSTGSQLLYRAMAEMDYRLAGSNIRMVKGGVYQEDSEYHISSWAG